MPRDIQKTVNRLYETLVQELDCYPGGDQFLSTRDLIRKYNVSRRAVEKTLVRLKDEGQIVIEPTSGIYVAHDRSKTTHVIASAHCDWPAEYWHNLDTKIEAEIKKYPGYNFIRTFFEPNSGKNYLQFLRNIKADAILFTFPIHRFTSAEIADILTIETPVVFLENNLLCDGINAIDSQPEYSGMMAADCLIRNGHRKLALLFSEPWCMGEERRNSGFFNYARLHGINPLVIDCRVQSGESSCTKAHDELLRYLKQNGPAFTGCYTMSDYSALGAISAIKEYGLKVPGDISIIGNSGIASGAHFDPPLTTVAHDIDGTAKAICQGMHDLFTGGKFGVRTVPAILIERKSVKNIQQQEVSKK